MNQINQSKFTIYPTNQIMSTQNGLNDKSFFNSFFLENSLMGWIEVYDSENDRNYYFNPETQESSWYHPNERNSETVETESKTDEEENVQQNTHEITSVNNDEKSEIVMEKEEENLIKSENEKQQQDEQILDSVSQSK